MVEDGILDEDEPVELLDGELVVVSPQGPRHAARLAELDQRLTEAYRATAHVRAQLPVEARPHSLPEPDLAVVRGAPRDFRDRHPSSGDVVLVVEIARTSHAVDRKKAGLYGAAGMPVYWLLDIANRCLEVFSGAAHDGFAQHVVLRPGEEVELPGLDARWPVADLVD
jgi:Uma2 family endonuclease